MAKKILEFHGIHAGLRPILPRPPPDFSHDLEFSSS